MIYVVRAFYLAVVALLATRLARRGDAPATARDVLVAAGLVCATMAHLLLIE